MRPRLLLARFGSGRRPGAPGGDPVEGALIVSRSGDNGNAGTLASPWRTLAYALTQASAGDTIYLRDGYYDVVGTDVYLSPLTKSGTSGDPITISSYPGERAIFDGINHSWHPRYFGDGNSPTAPMLLDLRGEHLVIEHLEFRNSVGHNVFITSRNSTFRHLVSRNAHATNFYAAMQDCEIHDNIFLDGHSVVNAGISGNGMVLNNSPTLDTTWPGAVATNNHIHRVVGHFNSDDAFNIIGTHCRNNVIEHCLATGNGVGGGNGTGYKIGLFQQDNTENTYRYCASVNDKNGWNTNADEGNLIHNCLTVGAETTGFLLRWNTAEPDSNRCNNTAYNNVSTGSGSFARIVGETGCIAALTTHTHNAGAPIGWGDGSNGSNNKSWTVEQLALVSTDIESADFGKLSGGSLALGAGITVNVAADQDLGPVPAGESFGRGWDWRTLMSTHPSVRMNHFDATGGPGGVPIQYPMPQNTYEFT